MSVDYDIPLLGTVEKTARAGANRIDEMMYESVRHHLLIAAEKIKAGQPLSMNDLDSPYFGTITSGTVMTSGMAVPLTEEEVLQQVDQFAGISRPKITRRYMPDD